uniref:INCENP_ARK-bind domain-containing protein n=1 Tax=Steinernema glaseri TaxID=37863 RepID=A0A1I7Z0C9_9BILA
MESVLSAETEGDAKEIKKRAAEEAKRLRQKQKEEASRLKKLAKEEATRKKLEEEERKRAVEEARKKAAEEERERIIMAEQRKKAAEEERKRAAAAAEEERKIAAAAAEEARRKAAKEAERQRIEEEQRRLKEAQGALKTPLQPKNTLAATEYEMTPDKVFKESTATNYNIEDLSSGDETDDDENPRKKVPSWAQQEQRRLKEAQGALKTPRQPKNTLAANEYEMTPDKQYKKSSVTNYNIEDLSSGDETDDDENPRKKVPSWAQPSEIIKAARLQDYSLADQIFPPIVLPDLAVVFRREPSRYPKRSSSAEWQSPLEYPKIGKSRLPQINIIKKFVEGPIIVCQMCVDSKWGNVSLVLEGVSEVAASRVNSVVCNQLDQSRLVLSQLDPSRLAWSR